MSELLTGKTIVIMGVANKRSIAWGCAQTALAQGAKLVLTYQNERIKQSLHRFVPDEADLIECDVADDDNIAQTFTTIGERYGKIDGLVHAIAFADKETLEHGLVSTSRAGYDLAQEISAYSLIAVAKAAQPLMTDGGSIVTLTYFGSERAVPHYNMMGVAKAALESSMRYLASELGEQGIRVNAISAGAIKTLAVTGIKDHGNLLKISRERTVDGKDVTVTEIGNVAAFLMSDMATGVTGDVMYVDKGVHLI